METSMKSSQRQIRFLTYAVLILGSISMIFPFVWMVLTCFKSAFGTFFLRQTYLGIPNEIAEAAYLDGCSKWQTFTRVLFPLICNTDLNMMTLSAGLSTLNGQFTTNFPVLMAGSLLAMIPMVIIYLIFQKQFIQGIAMTGGK